VPAKLTTPKVYSLYSIQRGIYHDW